MKTDILIKQQKAGVHGQVPHAKRFDLVNQEFSHFLPFCAIVHVLCTENCCLQKIKNRNKTSHFTTQPPVKRSHTKHNAAL